MSKLENLSKDLFSIILFYLDPENTFILKQVNKNLKVKVAKIYSKNSFWNFCLNKAGYDAIEDNPRGLYEAFLTYDESEPSEETLQLLESNPSHAVAFVSSLTMEQKNKFLSLINRLDSYEDDYVDPNPYKALFMILRQLLPYYLSDDKADFTEDGDDGTDNFIISNIIKMAEHYEIRTKENMHTLFLEEFRNYPDVMAIYTKDNTLSLFADLFINPATKDHFKLDADNIERLPSKELWNLIFATDKYDNLFLSRRGEYSPIPKLLKSVTPEFLEEYGEWLFDNRKNRPLVKRLSYLIYLFSDDEEELKKVYRKFSNLASLIKGFPNYSRYLIKHRNLSRNDALNHLFSIDFTEADVKDFVEKYLIENGKVKTKILKEFLMSEDYLKLLPYKKLLPFHLLPKNRLLKYALNYTRKALGTIRFLEGLEFDMLDYVSVFEDNEKYLKQFFGDEQAVKANYKEALKTKRSKDFVPRKGKIVPERFL